MNKQVSKITGCEIDTQKIECMQYIVTIYSNNEQPESKIKKKKNTICFTEEVIHSKT